jgi:cyclophilin family peptidyl-prolyl cis-trans isomerase|tara:strand:+ start:168 stop:794 length:627 start_codon:yes stop_codon:yes gene_type:complete
MKKGMYLFIIVLLCNCSPKLFNKKWVKIQAPEEFSAVFETTEGDFEIHAKRAWSPEGVDRLYALIKKGFYTDVSVFRVVPNFVAQFGIHNNGVVHKSWQQYGITDEPVVEKNKVKTIAFARGGVQTRTTQIFINLKDNPRLDKLSYGGVTGFPVVAKVTRGFENVLKFYNKYGDNLGRKQDSIQKFGNAFIRENYPEIAFIKKAYILK